MTITINCFTVELSRTHFYMCLPGWFGIYLGFDGEFVFDNLRNA
ncbi:hypothetical protein [Methylophaga nitratireducenticrescens]|nr:hypothetical protein [Methylophaga nitratireducenticrescens]